MDSNTLAVLQARARVRSSWGNISEADARLICEASNYDISTSPYIQSVGVEVAALDLAREHTASDAALLLAEVKRLQSYTDLYNIAQGILECLEHDDPWPKSARDNVRDGLRCAIDKIQGEAQP